MKKRAAAFLLAGILSMSMLAGCGSGNDGQGDTTSKIRESNANTNIRYGITRITLK